MNHFYNTINLSGDDLALANVQAISLEKSITAIFKANPGRKLSPSRVHEIYLKEWEIKIPINSVRRAMTNLSDKDCGEVVLEKMGKEDMITGPWGKPEHVWVLKGSLESIYQAGQESAGDLASKILSQGKFF